MPQSSLPPARQDADAQWLPAAPPVSASLTTSLCESHRDFIGAQLRLRRNATAIYQDLVDQHGFGGAVHDHRNTHLRL